MKAPPIFTTERDLCGAFIEFGQRQGWICYPETDSWDILLVSEDDGRQVGVQAKLRPNGEVIAQAVKGMRKPHAPVAVIVLVPVAVDWFLTICRELGFGVMTPNLDRSDLASGWVDFDELLSSKPLRRDPQGGNCRLPAHVPDVPAGVPSPKVLSQFREKELRLCAILRRNGGFLRPKDFRAVGIDRRTWRNPFVYRSGPSKYTPVIGRMLPDEDPAFRAVAREIAREMEAVAAR